MGETFYLYNNAILLAQSTVDSSSITCATGTVWNGTICTASLVNGSCSSPTTHYTCNSGTSSNNIEGDFGWTWDCLGSSGGTNASCTENKSGGGDSNSCFTEHYKCGDGTIIGTNQTSSPTKWTWVCGITSCSEKKSPRYIED